MMKYYCEGDSNGNNGILKIRCTDGLTVSNQIIPAMNNNPGMCTKDLGGDDSDDDDDEFYGMLWSARDEYIVPSITPHTTWLIPIHHGIGGISKQKEYAYVQMALQYSKGQTTYLKIHTMQCKITQDESTWFRCANGHAVATAVCRNAIPEPLNILLHYRQHTSARKEPIGQLVLPEKLQLLPLIMYSWNKKSPSNRVQFKSPILLKQSSQHNHHMALLSPKTVLTYLYPTLYRIPIDNQLTFTIVPTTQSSIIDFHKKCAYLLDAAYAFYVIHPWKQIPSKMVEFIESKQLRSSRPIMAPLIDLGDDINLFYQLCIEDDTSSSENVGGINGKNSYMEYLCQLHKKIRNILHPSD